MADTATVNVKLTIPQLDVLRDTIRQRAELFNRALTELYKPGRELTPKEREEILTYERRLHELQGVGDVFGVTVKP